MTSSQTGKYFAPINNQSMEPIKLQMDELWITGNILPIGARLMVSHKFKSAEKDPIEVIYAFTLPRDSSLRRFTIEGEDIFAHSELRPVKEAEDAYEKGIEDGHISVMTKNYRDGLNNLSIGNIKPGEEVMVSLEVLTGVELFDDGFRFKFPFTLSPLYHPEAKALRIDSETLDYQLPDDIFGDLILPTFKSDPSSLHNIGFKLMVDADNHLESISSPSHPISFKIVDESSGVVSLATDTSYPDRDLILDVKTREPLSALYTGIDNEDKGRFIRIIPTQDFGESEDLPQNVVFLLDNSGSMEGINLKKSKRALVECIKSLSEDDNFGLVVFNHSHEIFKESLQPATFANKENVISFIENIYAEGGTEIEEGIKRATELLGKSEGHIFLITDGQVAETETILLNIKDLKIKIHVLGIGTAGQDRFISSIARKTGGISSVVSPHEDIRKAMLKLFSSVKNPVAEDLKVVFKTDVNTSMEPKPVTTVHKDNPVIVYCETEKECTGELVLKWDNSRKVLKNEIEVKESKFSETISLLHGSRIISDLETEYLQTKSYEKDYGFDNSVHKRTQERIKRRLQKLGERYGLANREMSLVSVVERENDQAEIIPITKVVPAGMPQSTSMDSYMPLMQIDYLACIDICSELPIEEDELMISGENQSQERQYDSINIEEFEFESDFDVVDTSQAVLDVIKLIGPQGGIANPDMEQSIIASICTLFVIYDDNNEGEEFRLAKIALNLFLKHIGVPYLQITFSEKSDLLEKALDTLKTKQEFSGSWYTEIFQILSEKPIPEKEFWEKIKENI